jgi:hypothetical protein
MVGQRPVRRRLVIASVAVVGAVVLAAGVVAVDGWRARDHFRNAATLMATLRDQVASGDGPAARATLDALRNETGAARSNTSGPLWRLARHVPLVGDDLTAVATAARVLDDLAREVLPPLVEVLDSVTPATLAPRNGRVDIAALARAAPHIRAADAAIQRARQTVVAIDVETLVGPVRRGIMTLRRELEQAASQTATAARATALLPRMLGADGPRTYLVLFQNLAEVRATGGAPNAFAVVRADRGRIEMIAQGTATNDLGGFDAPVLRLDPAMRRLYTDRLGIHPADVTFTPHFPTAATLAREMFRRRSGIVVDGVVATDPVALSYLLRATGPVALPSGDRLTADNAVDHLLSDVYAQLASPQAQDDYFAHVAKASFEALTRGDADPAAALEALARAAAERRILVWSADRADRALIAGTILEGSLPDHDGPQPTVGVFLNDGTGAKLSYYLVHSASVSPGACRADGRRLLRLRVTLRSTAPPSGLSDSVVGTMGLVPLYTVRTNVLVFSPAGGSVVRASRDGHAIGIGSGRERRRQVGVVTVDLTPGAGVTLDFDLLTGAPPAHVSGEFRPYLWTTPGVKPWSVSADSAEFCQHPG